MERPRGCDVAQRRHLAGGLPDHPLDQIDAGDFFGDAVLDLQARVDFEEVEVAGVGVVDELDRAGGAVVDGAAEASRRLRRARARRRRTGRARASPR